MIIIGMVQGQESYIVDVSPGFNAVKKSKELPGAKPCVQVIFISLFCA